ncbi:MAG: hypothetical protein FJ109_10615 [Deltaproteobacteria bacterium]|nr:hypothetical protein [Deltaproteobacteria bacterium]
MRRRQRPPVDWDGCNSGKIVEFRVNKSTGGSQRRASVAVVGNGQFVIAWESDGSGCDQFDIVAQAFNAGGSTSGSEYKINGKTTLTQKLPWLTELQKEQFVAVWESELQGGADSFDIAARLMSFPGTPVAAEFKVNHHTADYQGNPRAAVFGDGGGFVVVWDSDNQDGSVAGVYARRYSATGTAQENMEFQANTYTTGWQGRPAAATCLDGSTQIFWESDGQDGGTYGVYGQGILGSGAFFQTEYKVNTTGAGDQSGPAAAGLDTCGVLVAWASVSPGEATSAIASQLLTAAGVKDGSEVLVSPYATAAAGGVAAVYQPKGGFVVAFHRCAKTAPDGTGCDVYFQRLDAAGKIVGPEVQVNLHTTSHQRWPAVAAFQNGSFVVVWESVEQDGNEEGVYAQRFTKDGTRIYH